MQTEVDSLNLPIAQSGNARDLSAPYPSHPLAMFKLSDVMDAQRKPEGWVDDDEDLFKD